MRVPVRRARAQSDEACTDHAQIMHRSTGTLCTHTDMDTQTPTAVSSSAIRAAGDLDKLTQDFNSWQEVKTLQTSTAACYNFAPDTVIMQLY